MWTILRRTFADFNKDRCPRIAAAMAYYTAFSLVPMLILITSVGQLVLSPEHIQGRVEASIENVAGPDAAEQLQSMLRTDRSQRKRGMWATAIGGLVLLLGATGLFNQMQSAINDIWAVRPDPDQGGLRKFVVKRLVSLGMLLTIAFLLVVSITVSAAVQALDSSIDQWLPGQSGSIVVTLADYAISFVITTCLFAAMFKILPDADVRWSDVWWGAGVTSALFLVGKFALAIYLGKQSTTDAFGAGGALVLLLMWVYFSSMIFLLGAEFTQVWAQERGAGIIPSDGALRVVERTKPAQVKQHSGASKA